MFILFLSTLDAWSKQECWLAFSAPQSLGWIEVDKSLLPQHKKCKMMRSV